MLDILFRVLSTPIPVFTRRFPRRGGEPPPGIAVRQGAVPKFPDLQPTGAPAPFPSGDAANDPKFPRRRPRPVGRVFGRVLGAAGVILTASDIKEMMDELDRQQREIEKAAEREIDERRMGRQVEPIEIEFPNPFEISDAPKPAPTPEVDRPASPEVEPEPIFQPFPPPAPIRVPFEIPVPASDPAPVPAPKAPPAPGGVPRPVGLPFGLPFALPFALPGGSPFPIGDPAPRLSPSPRTPLTGFDPRLVPFAGTAPDPAAQARPNQCEEVQRRRRRKGKCREGFFREESGKTKFVTWRTRDCATGETIRDTKRSRDRIIRDSENIIDLFGGL